MKGGNPDKNRVSAFSFSLLFRHFPDSLQKRSKNGMMDWQVMLLPFLFCFYFNVLKIPECRMVSV